MKVDAHIEIGCNLEATDIASMCEKTGLDYIGKSSEKTAGSKFDNNYIVSEWVHVSSEDLPRYFNSRSNSHRETLGRLVGEDGLEDRIFKKIWKELGFVDIEIFWTVAAGDSQHDAMSETTRADYSRLMLHPLEQLAEMSV